ncbi:hypothetical protein Pmar_PMAR017689 [Perkinsus marinus ATCC 50983]|uniref:Uncharacterized protein n=1 Tax=Perkinsus marinus (strain ATCC 50983 / TXsc) TaxID=423536 RepID=C5L3Q5_PERM5|nr:hypothetical protein Pmar_PMAR017689 [Perkinsus marinus ATCC 50983]EER08634.1 hypothetical protein Pmar_PMAR017689 [Perkinsus marinus ATCC 50983]|eukprot:XP_002776818.1 hypothetical protein Pmar_PMAR017689 [Perkinsus marinus ATCC 50983]
MTPSTAALSFEDVVKVEFDFAVRTVKRAAIKFSEVDDTVDADSTSLAASPPGSHHLGALIQALISELRGRKPHVGRELLHAVSHELVLYGHLRSLEFYEGLGKSITNRQKMQFIFRGMQDPSFDGDFVEIFPDLVGCGVISVEKASLYTLRREPYNLSEEQTRRLVLELVENVCDDVDQTVAMVRRMYHPSEVAESNACWDAIMETMFFDDIVRLSSQQEEDVRKTICGVFPEASEAVEKWIQRREEEGDTDSLDSFVVSDLDEFDDDSDGATEATTASVEGEGAIEEDDVDNYMSAVDNEERAVEASTEGHGRLRKARDVPTRRDGIDFSSTADNNTRSNSENDYE